MLEEYLNLIQTLLRYLEKPASVNDFGCCFRFVHVFNPPETQHCQAVYFLTQIPKLIDFDSRFVCCC